MLQSVLFRVMNTSLCGHHATLVFIEKMWTLEKVCLRAPKSVYLALCRVTVYCCGNRMFSTEYST